MKIDSPNAIGISTGFGIPTGGTQNQYLIKNSSTNFDTTWDSGIVPVYLSVNKNTSQFLPFSIETTITTWDTPFVNTIPTSWNGTTGVWTCPRSGTYDISLSLMLSNVSPDTIFKEFAPIISFNGTPYIASWWSTYTNLTINTPTVTTRWVLQLTAGDIIRPRAYQDLRLNTAYNIVQGRNGFIIQELPKTITR